MSLNKQEGPNRIEWPEVFGPGTGHTWNYNTGCYHGCAWRQADGSLAECYAKTIADKQKEYYPNGFDYSYFHPNRLNDPLKHTEPAGIFLDSMSDLMGHWVPDEEIHKVFDVCTRTPQHIYFLLTKNAPRLPKFNPYPSNVWVGASMPPSLFIKDGIEKTLLPNQQIAMLETALDSLSRVKASVVWMSFEPLSWDVSKYVLDSGVQLKWAVIGATSHRGRWYQPNPKHIWNLIQVLEGMNCRIFFKGNLRPSLGKAFDEWLEEYPPFEAYKPAQQLSMFD